MGNIEKIVLCYESAFSMCRQKKFCFMRTITKPQYQYYNIIYNFMHMSNLKIRPISIKVKIRIISIITIPNIFF